MFEQLRQSLNELLERATKPEDRRTIVARMKTTLVQATLGLDDLRSALRMSERKLESEKKELETVKRRRELAQGINDAETVTVADRFEKQHQERVTVLEEKIAVMTRELELAEREVAEMKAEIKAAMIGGPATPGAVGGESLDEDSLAEDAAAAERVKSEIDALARQRARADRDAEADRRLEELKKKMGK